MTTHAIIEEAEAAFNTTQYAYLRRHGWEQTCRISSLWLWTRDFTAEDHARVENWQKHHAERLGERSRPKPYGVLFVPLSTALHITRAELDHDPQDDDGDA